MLVSKLNRPYNPPSQRTARLRRSQARWCIPVCKCSELRHRGLECIYKYHLHFRVGILPCMMSPRFLNCTPVVARHRIVPQRCHSIQKFYRTRSTRWRRVSRRRRSLRCCRASRWHNCTPVERSKRGASATMNSSTHEYDWAKAAQVRDGHLVYRSCRSSGTRRRTRSTLWPRLSRRRRSLRCCPASRWHNCTPVGKEQESTTTISLRAP